MIQSLSDRNRKKGIKQKRIFLITGSVLLLGSWFFLRPVFLIIFDPLLSLYFEAKSSAYTSLEKAKTFFVSKEQSLTYIKELEEENSRLHNELARFDYDECTRERKGLTENYIISASETATTTVMKSGEALTSTSTKENHSLSIIPPVVLADPCQNIKGGREGDGGDIIKVSPLVSPLAMLYDTFRINKGEQEGIHTDDIVFTRGRVALGKVVSTTRNTALVRLYSKNTIENYGTLLGKDISFKVMGNGGGSYVGDAPRDLDVKEGDTILLTENQDLAFGTVSLVSFQKEDVSKKIFIKGGFNPSSLGALYVTLQK